jgi:hypothetical protein
MAHGDALEGKWRGNWRMEWVASTLHTTSERGVFSITNADAHTSAASSRLNWRPRRFKWTRPFRRKTKSCFCACAITFKRTITIHLEGIYGMRAVWGWYSSGEGIWLRNYYLCDCACSECSSGQCFWDWYFSVTSPAIKLVLASYFARPFCLHLYPFPRPASSVYLNWAVEMGRSFSMPIHLWTW